MTKTAICSSRKAVTLIETIMVIAVLAAAAVGSTILFQPDWIDRRAARAATNQVADTLMTARNTAITNQADVAVRPLRSGGKSILLINETAGPLRSGKSWVVELDPNVHVHGSPREIQFQPTGMADRTLDWNVTHASRRGRVSVAAASGRVTRHLP